MGAWACSALLGVEWGWGLVLHCWGSQCQGLTAVSVSRGRGLVLHCWGQDGGGALFCTAGGRMGVGPCSALQGGGALFCTAAGRVGVGPCSALLGVGWGWGLVLHCWGSTRRSLSEGGRKGGRGCILLPRD